MTFQEKLSSKIEGFYTIEEKKAFISGVELGLQQGREIVLGNKQSVEGIETTESKVSAEILNDSEPK